jgi:Tfp pilus assembly protein PilO
MEEFLDLYLARIIKIILLFLNVQDLNHTDYFQSEQDDLIPNNRNTKCHLNKKLQQKDTQAVVQIRET